MRHFLLEKLLLATVCFLPFTAWAQGPDDHIDLQQPDLLLLSRLVKEGIDSVRIARRLNGLEDHEALAKAAADHAGFILKKRQLTHFQSGKKRTPQDRVDFYGGSQFIAGENAALIYVHVNTISQDRRRKGVYQIHTYREAASELVTNWIASKPHYENLKRKEYTHTGVGVSADPSTGALWAVQVFGVLISR